MNVEPASKNSRTIERELLLEMMLKKVLHFHRQRD